MSIDAFADESALLGLATMTKTALVIPPGLSFTEWSDMGHPLITIAQASMWWVGDWLRYGEHEYGEKYQQAVEATGYGLSTLKNAQWVADRFAPEERREDVTFSQHKAIAGLDPKPRKELLRRAADEHMTEGELRGRVKAIKAGESPSETSGRAGKVEVIEPDPPTTEAEAVDRALGVLNQAYTRGEWPLVLKAVEILETGRGLREAEIP